MVFRARVSHVEYDSDSLEKWYIVRFDDGEEEFTEAVVRKCTMPSSLRGKLAPTW